jgi:hypothetical protein
MMSELRQRAGVPKDAPRSSTTTTKDRGNDAQSRTRSGISILDIFRVILTLAVVSCGLSYYLTETVTWGYNPWFTNWSQLVRYVVCLFIFPPYLARSFIIRLLDVNKLIERPNSLNTIRALPLRRHKPRQAHLCCRERDHFRRVREPTHVWSRWRLSLLRRARRNPRVCNGMFC